MGELKSVDEIIEALAHLVCSDREGVEVGIIERANRRHHAISPTHFDGFEVLTTTDDDDKEDWILTGAHANDQPIWPMDITTANLCAHDGWPEGTWIFSRWRTLVPKEWRGKLPTFTPRMVEEAFLISRPDGEHTTGRLPYSLINGFAVPARTTVQGLRHNSVGNYGISPSWFGQKTYETQDVVRATSLVRLAAGFSLRRQYLWSVLLGEGGDCPRARFVTDPLGVREAFRLRDIPPGKRRRAALLHWVKAHWRKHGRASEADRAWINAHLRGAWSYTWNGLLCQIEPSIEDMSYLSKNADAA